MAVIILCAVHFAQLTQSSHFIPCTVCRHLFWSASYSSVIPCTLYT